MVSTKKLTAWIPTAGAPPVQEPAMWSKTPPFLYLAFRQKRVVGSMKTVIWMKVFCNFITLKEPPSKNCVGSVLKWGELISTLCEITGGRNNNFKNKIKKLWESSLITYSNRIYFHLIPYSCKDPIGQSEMKCQCQFVLHNPKVTLLQKYLLEFKVIFTTGN